MSRNVPNLEAFPELDPNWQNSKPVKPSNQMSAAQDRSEPQFQGQGSTLVNRFEEADATTCIAVICGCSLVVLIQAAVECGGELSDGCQDEFLYTVVVGVISFITSLLCVFWGNCGETSFRQFSPIVAIFFLVWWGLGTGVSTFSEPFANSGNGYFAAWGAFIASFIMVGAASDRLRQFLGTALTRVLAGSIEAKLYIGIAVASLVMLAAVAVEASDYDHPTSQELWGVVCATVSFFVVLFHTLMRLVCEGLTLPPTILGVFLTLWWLPGVAVLTFDEPFKYASNGFFAAWLGFIFAVWLALEGLDGYGGMGWGNRNVVQQIGDQQPR